VTIVTVRLRLGDTLKLARASARVPPRNRELSWFCPNRRRSTFIEQSPKTRGSDSCPHRDLRRPGRIMSQRRSPLRNLNSDAPPPVERFGDDSWGVGMVSHCSPNLPPCHCCHEENAE
jgi:hypothetical protein